MKLSGYVHEDDGSWVSGAVVEAFLENLGGIPAATTSSDGNGYWEFPDLDPGAYIVRISWGDSVRYRYPNVAWQTGGLYDSEGQVIVQGSPGFVPSGAIMVWSGAIEDIPTGWLLCDGEDGTPDLRNRFVVGAGERYEVGDTGGVERVTLSVSQMPAHSHNCGSSGAHSHTISVGSGFTSHESSFGRALVGSGTVETSSTGSHSHSIGSRGGGGSHENLPPYYALAFIMKV